MKHFLALASVLVVAGCSRGGLSGTYELAAPDLAADKASPTASMKLELRGNGSFALAGVRPIEGSYRLEGKSLTLTPEKIGGQPISEFAKSQPKTIAEKIGEPLRLTILESGSLQPEYEVVRGQNLVYRRVQGQ